MGMLSGRAGALRTARDQARVNPGDVCKIVKGCFSYILIREALASLLTSTTLGFLQICNMEIIIPGNVF